MFVVEFPNLQYKINLIRGEYMRRINHKDYLANQEYFKDYEDFKNIKKELNIYDFQIMTFEELEQWIKDNNTLRIENNKEYERRKQHLTKLAIISKLYFLD